MDDTVDSGRPGAWLTLREAADRLGISEKTARRRVKAGAPRRAGAETPVRGWPTG